MTSIVKTWALTLTLVAALLAGCRNGRASGEGEIRLPIISQGQRPVISDQVTVSPYTGETAREMGQPDAAMVPGPQSTVSANRPLRPEPPDEPPVPLVPVADQESPAATGAPKANNENEPVSIREAGQYIKVANTIVARVNDEIVTLEDLVRPIRGDMVIWRNALPPQEFAARLNMELRNRLRAEVSRRVILCEARKTYDERQTEMLGQQVDKERQQQIDLAGGSVAVWRDRLATVGLTEDLWRQEQLEVLMVQSFLYSYLKPRLTVSREEMLDYYEKVKAEEFVTQDQAQMQLIKLRRRDHADEEAMMSVARSLVGRARSGEDFAKLAREFSRGPKAADGGDWGMVHRDSHRVDAVNEALFTLPVGSISDPIPSDDGLYIVRVAARQEGRTLPFTEVQDACREAVRMVKREKMVLEYIQELYKKNFVETYEENL